MLRLWSQNEATRPFAHCRPGRPVRAERQQTATAVAELWGKSRGLESPYPLAAHLLDAAAASQAVVDRMLPPSLVEKSADAMGLPAADWAQLAKVLAAWHDCGKASAGFQNQDAAAVPQWLAGRRDAPGAGCHDLIGGRLAWDHLGCALDDKTRCRLAQIVAGHHGIIRPLNVRDMLAYGGEALVDSPSPPPQLAAARTSLWEVLDRCAGPVPDRLRTVPLMAASTLLAVVVLADWLASDLMFIEAQAAELGGAGDLDSEAHYRRARRLAAAAIADNGLAAPEARPAPTPHTMFGRPEAVWTPLQASVAEGFAPTGPGIIAIAAPTGEGRTEAALIAAHKLAAASGRHGFFFAVPEVAAAEGLHGRLSGYLGRSAPAGAAPPLRRAHSQAMLYETPEAQDAAVSDDPAAGGAAVSDDPAAVRAAARWMRGACKPMVAPFGIGTIDQLVVGAMKARHSPVRMLGAALGCVIVDGAHTLDPHMRHLLARTVEWLAALGTPVVVLSAAAPAARTAGLLAAYQKGANSRQAARCGPPRPGGYPMWAAWTAADGPACSADSGGIAPARSWDVRFDTAHVPARHVTGRIAEAAVAAADKGLCVLAVRSTVRAAQDTYDQVRSLDPGLAAGDTVEILHSRMPHRARRDRSERLAGRLGPNAGARPDRLVLVAAQPAEQSLDACFDLLVTDPAPMADLLERVGRIRRRRPPPHGRPAPAVVIWPLDGDGDWQRRSPMFAEADLAAAHSCLTARGAALTVRVPDDVPAIIEQADQDAGGTSGCAASSCGPGEGAGGAQAQGAVLARLAAAAKDASAAENWAVPHPWEHSKPLDTLTGPADIDGDSPAARQSAVSALVVPAARHSGRWLLEDGTEIDAEPDSPPPAHTVRACFAAAIPAACPHPGWAAALVPLAGAWDHTPLAGALILPDNKTSASSCEVAYDPETGLRINPKAAL